MRVARSNHPVGATWEARDDQGYLGRVWLEKRDYPHEVWRWAFFDPDGSYDSGDWAPSYRKAMEECRVKFGYRRQSRPRFRRVKEHMET